MKKITCLIILGMIFIFFGTSYKQSSFPDFIPGEVLVKFRTDFSEKSAQTALSQIGLSRLKDFTRLDIWHLKIETELDVFGALDRLRELSMIEYAEPNYLYHTCKIPNDQHFSKQWGLHNTGQSDGIADADIDAPEGWDIQTGSGSVLIGVIDSGVDYKHEDLKSNIWTNPGEDAWSDPNNPRTGNGIDDDGNGKVDDWKGWNFISENNDPMDDNDHGTHCAGIIGAEGDNNIGIAGVDWNAKIMPLKFLNSEGSGTTANAIEAILYAIEMGVDILSNSWGSYSESFSLREAIAKADSAGILFVAAAGNDGINNDADPHYPSGYDAPNVIAVAASDDSDKRSIWGSGGGSGSDCGSCSLSPQYGEPIPYTWNNGQNVAAAPASNFGPTSVDLAAPGTSIYSTIRSGGYEYFSGTSMATPFVAGAASLIKSKNPNISHLEIKNIILQKTDYLADFAGKSVTEGRLNIYNALTTTASLASK